MTTFNPNDFVDTRTLVTDDIIAFREKVYSGDHPDDMVLEGHRTMIAQVTRTYYDERRHPFVSLIVINCVGDSAHKKNTAINRRVPTVLEGQPKRKRWDDEEARHALVARMLDRRDAQRSARAEERRHLSHYEEYDARDHTMQNALFSANGRLNEDTVLPFAAKRMARK